MAGKGATAGTHPLIWLGGVVCACGILLIILDIIFHAIPIAITGFTGIIFGIFYIITGSLTVAAGKSVQTSQDNARCLLIAALVLSILALIDSFGLLIFAITLTIVWPVAAAELLLYLLVLGMSIGVIVVIARSPALRAPPTQTVVVHHQYGPPLPQASAPPPYPPAGQPYPAYGQPKV